ncbi:Zinc finger RING-type [Arabidopsis thaliana x Arabidopsis arenosa]|uniref:RING-type E3 ubiquitin transferase n=1 Tax=Arabidopsis thaliana x Arabidopsis arenosa TaxID=1240361 RepID=A0A8T2ABM0_9BRAS|nr:Zinc finger RING-type [Arabidopsis thaliana x Arabidopsis arenosa]
MSSDNKTNDDSDRSFWQNSTSYDASSKIMLVTTVSFSVIILIVFVYYLYAKFVLHRRRSTFQDLSFSVVSHPPKRGLDTLVIASLPTFVVGVKNDVAGTECAVCLSLLEEKDNARMLPNCKHVFHVTCVDTWLTTQSTCPVCRTEAEPSPRLEPEPREGPVGDVAPPLDFVGVDNKTGGSSVLRLDSFRRILTRERSSNRLDHSRVDQDRVLDIERH